MSEKAIIFDSGTLITLSMNDLLDMLRELKKTFNGKFIITREVENEIVLKPMRIKRFKLGAIRLKRLIDDGTLEFVDSVGVNQQEISRMTKEILKDANSLYVAEGKPVHIIDEGEASILALSKLLRDKGIKNMIAMDERTTRMLCERPENLKHLLQRKLHTKVTQQKKRNDDFHKSQFLRSTELIFVAYKKGIIPKNKELLDAMLYAAKFKGAAISSEEIKVMKKL
jgi:predicted nucleic acid-binding protein